MQQHTFLIFQPDTSRIHTSFNSVCFSFCFGETTGWGVGWLRGPSSSSGAFHQSAWSSGSPGRRCCQWAWQQTWLEVSPWCLGKSVPHHFWEVKHPLGLQSKSGTELLPVSCSEAIWQRLSVYGWDFGLSQYLKSKHSIFWSFSPHTWLYHVVLLYAGKWT